MGLSLLPKIQLRFGKHALSGRPHLLYGRVYTYHIVKSVIIARMIVNDLMLFVFATNMINKVTKQLDFQFLFSILFTTAHYI